MSDELTRRWKIILAHLEKTFEGKTDLNKVLLLIGIREVGLVKDKFTKEEKVKLMHIAVCRVLSQSGFYMISGMDEEGWPHWEKVMDVPYLDVFEQEHFLRQHIVEYFESEEIVGF
jgi:hypothetical protein